MKALFRTSLVSLSFLLAVAFAGLPEAHAQVSVAPTTVVMENRNPFGEFIVANQSAAPQEVRISFQFGYPRSDEKGEIYMEYEDVAQGEPRDLGERVRAFPRAFVLPPGEQQTVRLMVSPDADAVDGVYWSRIVTTSNPRDEDVETRQVQEGVGARIAFQIRHVTTVLFKQGDAHTGVDVHGLEANIEDDELVILADLERTGNAPFIGRSHLRIFDDAGEVVLESEQNVSLYFELLRRLTASVEDLAPGDYRAELEFRAGQRDIARADRISMDPVSAEIGFQIPER
ncbi:hypothetical protein IC757_03625 [Wenzhouxiangella sp. AB-CW3]|uniref:hypothetical protein n=1 Tax=Wenzhouxiangella sp. AB-CW3 TaxID=2771012 RepID=UPI00168AB08E|nr:hypothetical protein [Wenzhouxiangella sp. AB-CW3]QOC23253.1 hypothetical protein IC757_03625 [Wenzhouxiangella sp. AB-CW3]